MFRTGIKAACRARHSLVGDFGDETIPHEHEYQVEWIVTVSGLDEYGFGVNIDLLNEKLADVIADLEGRMLNDIPFFHEKQTSIENTALYLYTSLYDRLREESYPLDTMEQWEIVVWESDIAWASYVRSDFNGQQ
jgi:6-pyruvoyltetrahydropterin/6-carboxytetrahydropterin synthase